MAEDEALIYFDVCDAIEAAGHKVAGPAQTVKHALLLVETERVDIAVIDAVLKDGSGAIIAKCLRERGIPFIVVSGHSRDMVVEWLGTASFVEKPFSTVALLAEIERLLALPGKPDGT